MKNKRKRRTKLDVLVAAAWQARDSYYATRSDAARKRLKIALRNVLLAGGRLSCSRTVSDWQNEMAGD